MSDIYDELRRFEEAMNRIFENVWNVSTKRGHMLLPPGERAIETFSGRRKPFIDVFETDKEVVATAEMPGLEKKDININLTEDKLEISAETKREEERQDKGYTYRERRGESYYRSVYLPSNVYPDNTKATYNNGILEIKMPKIDIKKKTELKIE